MENQNLTTVFKCFLRAGLEFTREDTNAVGQTFMGELRKLNPNFKPTKIEQREFTKYFTVNAFPVEFESLIMSCVEEHRKANNLQPRQRNAKYGQQRKFQGGGNPQRRNYQSGTNRNANHSPGYKPYGNKPYGNRAQGDGAPSPYRPYGSRPQGDVNRPPNSDQHRPYGERPQGGNPYPYNSNGRRPDYNNRDEGRYNSERPKRKRIPKKKAR